MNKYIPEIRLEHQRIENDTARLTIVYCDETERGRIRKKDNNENYEAQYNNCEKQKDFNTFDEALTWLVPNLEK